MQSKNERFTPLPAKNSKVLLVEDHAATRRELAKFLEKHELTVRQAADSQQALREASESPIGTVLMDHILHDEVDGIDLACAIQKIHPHSTVIFVSGRDLTSNDWKRIREFELRVGGEISKPVDRQKLLQLVQRSQSRQKAFDLLEDARTRGFDPVVYLHALADLDSSLPQDVFAELLEELTATDKATDRDTDEETPLTWSFQGAPEMTGVAAEIEEIYENLRVLFEKRVGDPGLAAEAAPLQKRLRELQEKEADAMEQHFRKGLRFDPENAQRNLERAEKLLNKK